MLNNVSFRAGALDSARDLINQPQKHSNPQQAQMSTEVPPKAKKSNKLVKALVGTAIGAAVIAAGLALGNKYNAFEKLIAMGTKEGAGTVSKWIGKAGELMNTGGEKIIGLATKAWTGIKGLVGKGETAEVAGLLPTK